MSEVEVDKNQGSGASQLRCGSRIVGVRLVAKSSHIDVKSVRRIGRKSHIDVRRVRRTRRVSSAKSSQLDDFPPSSPSDDLPKICSLPSRMA